MTFLAGYLGAGKTTLLNSFLARTDRPVAVLVNDVGEVNIDARLIRKRTGDTIELTDGCVCCSISEGFGAALDQLRARETPPDHVLVELSGVGIPNRVTPWAKSAGFRLDGVITVIDGLNFPTSMTNPVSAATIEAQLGDADLVLVSKTDVATPDTVTEIRNAIDRINPATQLLDAGDDLAAALIDLGGRRPGGVVDLPTPTLFDAHTVDRMEIPVASAAEMTQLLDNLGPEVVRAKGVGRSVDGDLLLLERVGHRSSVNRLPDPEAEDVTDLVVISTPG